MPPSKSCPNFQKALNQINSTNINFLQEFAGYSLTTETNLETSIWFLGPPGCGKSTILEGLYATFGDRAASIGLANFEESRFGLSNIIGKTLLISSEQPVGPITSSHRLNAIISGEEIQIDVKYKDPVFIKPTAKIIWAMNYLPQGLRQNDGLTRRVRIIKFPELCQCNRDPELKVKIQQEKAGIFNWCLEGLRRLRENKQFSFPPNSDLSSFKNKSENKSIEQFIAQRCSLKSDQKMQSFILYEEYKKWCHLNKFNPLNQRIISKELEKLGLKKSTINGRVFWQGIMITVK